MVEVAEVPPSIILSSAAVDVILVPPISKVVAETSPATVRIPLARVIKSSSPVCPMVVPLIKTLSTVSVVKVPRDVIFACAAVANVPVMVPVPLTLIPATPANTKSSTSSSHNMYALAVAPKNLTSCPVPSTPTVTAPASATENTSAFPIVKRAEVADNRLAISAVVVIAIFVTSYVLKVILHHLHHSNQINQKSSQ